MKRYIVQLGLLPDEVLHYYTGQAAAVRARSHSGSIVQFPAAALRTLVDASGVHGRFCLIVDADGRLLDLERIEH